MTNTCAFSELCRVQHAELERAKIALEEAKQLIEKLHVPGALIDKWAWKGRKDEWLRKYKKAEGG